MEVALLLPLLSILLLGTIDLGLVIREHQLLQNAAREGARFSALPKNKIDPVTNPPATPEAIRDRVINYLAQENITISAVACTQPNPPSKVWTCGDITISQEHQISTTVGGTTFTDFGSAVTVTYTRAFLIPGGPYLPFNNVTLTGTAVFPNLYGN